MSKFIVLDIVFHSGSLNYDQGSGNFSELKKITKWDGRQYTYVSRYALRYSILEQARAKWNIAPGEKLQKAGDTEKSVIQPAVGCLLSGEILEYPEFDLFGYLVTNTVPANSRVSPVRISPAISLTPFSYDNLLSGNLGLAKRRIEQEGGMNPNLFNSEEHYTYYVYSVVIDVDAVGTNRVYLAKKHKKTWEVKIEHETDPYTITISKTGTKTKPNLDGTYKVCKSKPVKTQEPHYQVENKLGEKNEVYEIRQSVSDEQKKYRIKSLIETLLSLQRQIRGDNKNLSPQLVVAGVYKNRPYQTFKDRISLADEYEETYEESSEPTQNGKKMTVRVRKTKRPAFYIDGIESNPVSTTNDMVAAVLTHLGYSDDWTNTDSSGGGESSDSLIKAFYLNDVIHVKKPRDNNQS